MLNLLWEKWFGVTNLLNSDFTHLKISMDNTI